MCFILCEHHRQAVLDVLDSEGFSLDDVDEDFEQQIVRKLYRGTKGVLCSTCRLCRHVDNLIRSFQSEADGK